MENQHRKIVGYRELTEAEIALMNEIKAEGENLRRVVEMIAVHPEVDQRWLAIAQTDLQKGIMALTRAVARPTTF